MTERAPRQKTRGFSIMELLIVVAIILIIAAVAIPNFQKVMAEIRLRSSASAVAGVIQQARIRSVRDNKIYSVAIDTSVTPNMVFVDLNNSGAFNGQEPNASLASDVTYQTICAPCFLDPKGVRLHACIQSARAAVRASDTLCGLGDIELHHQ